jgi:hypothetical protein
VNVEEVDLDPQLSTFQPNVANARVYKTVNIGVYTTKQCTQNLTSILWGPMRLGNNYTRTGYIRNNGNTKMTLSLSTGNWNLPALSNVLQVTWNYAVR